MQNMLPYYIYQASNIYYSTSRHHGKFLLKDSSLEEDDIKKKAMFNRLIELYITKSMPLEEGSLVNRADVIEELMKSRDSNAAILIGY